MKHHFLLVGQSPARPALLQTLLGAQFEATVAEKFGQAIAFARTKRPTALVVLGDCAEPAVQEWIGALTLQPGTSSLPLVAVSPAVDVGTALGVFQGGASALLDESQPPNKVAHDLIEAVGTGPGDPRSKMATVHSGSNLLRRLVWYLQHQRATCTVRIDGAPSPAGMRFVDGQLADAVFGGTNGQSAAGMLLASGDSSRWRFSLHSGARPPEVPDEDEEQLAVQPPTVIEADDEEEIVLYDEGADEETFNLDEAFEQATGVGDEETEDFIELSGDDWSVDLSLDDDFDAPAAEASDQSIEDALGPPHVLVVDDDVSLLNLYSTMLSRQGYKVSTAENGSAGYALARENHPDLIVSDVMMPDTDGWGLLGLVRGDYAIRETLFALLSCHTDFLGSLKDFNAGADEYLEKGLRPSEVVERLEGLLRPRRELYAAIKPGRTFSGDLHTLGAAGTLTRLSEVQATGMLRVRPRDLQVEVHFQGGNISLARVNSPGGPVAVGDNALALLLGFDAAPFTFDAGALPEGAGGTPFDRAAPALVAALNRRQTESQEDMLARDVPLRVTRGELGKFYMVSCADNVRPIVHALFAGKSPRTVMVESDFSPLLIEGVVKDVLRKGVMRFADGAA